MATKASRIALAGSNISSTGEVDADLLDNIDSAAFLSLDSNGRLGIGASTLTAPLNIQADGDARTLRIIGRSDDYSEIDFYENDNSTILSRIQAHNTMFNLRAYNVPIQFQQSNNTKMTIAADGNVGIGEDTPLAKLHVVGGRTSGTTYNTIIAAGGVNSTDGSGARIILSGCENDPLARGTVIEGISAGTGNSHKLNFKTNSGSEVPATRMTIGPTGNVGIGTDNPQAKLHVEGNIRSSANIGVTQTDGDYLAKLYQSSADGFLELYTGEATPVSRVKLSAYGDSYIAPSTTSGLGVGTTSPSERLHVVGDIQQQSTHNGNDKCIEAFFNIYTNTSYNTVWTANINTAHEGLFYEVICYGGDWGSHSSARVIKRGFVNGYNGYSGHQEIESAGPYASNISGQLLWSGNTVTYQMRLDSGGVTLRGMVRLIGHFTGYTVY
jgi:hypothetical protein